MSRNKIYRPFPPTLHVFDAPALFDGDEEVAGIYIGATTGGLGQGTEVEPIRSAPDVVTVFMSRDGGTTYHELVTCDIHVNSGVRISDFSDHTPPTDAVISFPLHNSDHQLATGLDRISTLTIRWHNQYVPISVTDAELNNNQNRLLIGNTSSCEVLQFKTATAVDASIGLYNQTHLVRGRHGTENDIGKHDNAVASSIVAVNDGLHFVKLKASDVGRTLHFKALVSGMALSDVATEYQGYKTLTYTGRNVAPFAPVHVTGTRDGSNNLTIAWRRRTRFPVRLLGYNNRPLGEDVEAYQVEVLSAGAPYTVLRTIDATTTSCSYTAAEHSTDSLTAGGAVNLRVYQKSNYTGRGQTGFWTIPANTGGAGDPTAGATYIATRAD